ncbi:hypothetical protein ACFYO8_00300 [Micromonospora sp. NPDC005257]|uniref:Cas10/Cmr2 second palm domain-containing protein n=1 Tax=Micromonospora sp. NPDC005257 TaxID=3364230 RepID=UPI003674D268
MTTDPRTGAPSAERHWVLIETGGNQRYIFGSNRMRHVVGASQLVHEVGTEWAREAVDRLGLPYDPVVMTASGKALLLVDSPDTGHAVIRTVSERALAETPGLRVTGVVGPPFDPMDDTAHEKARVETYRLQARVRAARPDPLVRDRVFPWHRLCRDSGQPAEREEVYSDAEPSVPTSAGMLARSRARRRARNRLVGKLTGRLAQVVPAHLDVLRHSGWVAVIHADGNGVGGLFRGFVQNVAEAEYGDRNRPVSLETHRRYQRDVARELDDATWDAVRDAIADLLARWREDDLRERLLPIVVGGDDVTLACDAALAVPFLRAFADAFARHTAERPTLSAVARAATGHPGLTASAGFAVVKSHHPFGTAYNLAEALTVSAKRFKDGERALAGFDFHVAHASSLRDLAELREYVQNGDGTRVARHAGPYLFGRAAALPDELRHRSVELLDEVSGWLGPDGWLTAAQAHTLREAADRGLAEYRHQLALLVGRATDPDRAHRLLDVQRDPVTEAEPDPEPFLRLFDALHLRGLRLQAPELAAAGSVSNGGVA